MIVRVVPLRNLPRGHDVFDYRVPLQQQKMIAIGTEVVVPLRQRFERAVVWSFPTTSEAVALKSIHALTDARPVLTLLQHDSIEWIIKNYGGSRTTLVRPLLKGQRGVRLAPFSSPNAPAGKTTIMVADHTLLSRELRRIINEQGNGGALLIVAPTLPSLAAIHTLAREAMSPKETLVALHGRNSLSQHRRVATLLAERKRVVVVSTKIGLLAPWMALDHIIVCHPSSDHHKQWDREPRYDARELAAMMSKKWHIPLTVLSSSPTLNQWQETTSASSAIVLACPWERWELPSRRWWEDPEHPMLGVLESAERRQRSVIIVYNERSMLTLAFCSACRCPWACGQCGRLLRFQPTSMTLQCSFCTRPLIPATCRQCGSPTTAKPYRSRLLPAILENLATKLPVKRVASIEELFLPAPAIACVQDRLMEELASSLWSSRIPSKPPASLLLWNLPTLNLATGYRSAEQQWQNIEQCTRWADAWNIAQRVIVGFLEEHLKDAVSSRDPERFYCQELALRERYHYPPYRDLILLDEHIQSSERSKLERIESELRAALPGACETSEIVTTVPRRQQYGSRKWMLIKILPLQREQILGLLIKMLPTSISIDHNPVYGV